MRHFIVDKTCKYLTDKSEEKQNRVIDIVVISSKEGKGDGLGENVCIFWM